MALKIGVWRRSGYHATNSQQSGIVHYHCLTDGHLPGAKTLFGHFFRQHHGVRFAQRSACVACQPGPVENGKKGRLRKNSRLALIVRRKLAARQAAWRSRDCDGGPHCMNAGKLRKSGYLLPHFFHSGYRNARCKSCPFRVAEIVGHDASDAVVVFERSIKTQFIMHQPENEQAGSHAHRQSGNIDCGIGAVFQ